MVLSRLESATKPNEAIEVDLPTGESDDPIGDLLAELIPDERPTDVTGIDDAPLVIATIRAIGRLTMALGVLLLLFAAFQLWGTGFAEAKAQNDLKAEFEQERDSGAPAEPERAVVRGSEQDDPTMREEPAEAALVGKPDPLVVDIAKSAPAESTEPPLAAPDPEPAPATPTIVFEQGDPIGVLTIPTIGVEKAVAEGTSRDVLRSGPGHYQSTPLPGSVGNVAIAGHRTTHGAPFLDIDQLKPGDEITFETLDGTYTYAVDGHDDGAGGQLGHVIVSPDEVGVIADKGDTRLTLTACHPKYSARQRIIVTATLVSGPRATELSEPLLSEQAVSEHTVSEQAVSEVTVSENTLSEQATTAPNEPAAPIAGPVLSPSQPSAAAAVSEPVNDLVPASEAVDMTTESLGWQPSYITPTGLWAAATALIAATGLALARLWRRLPAYAVVSPPFVLALFYCFSNLEKLIPAV